MLCTETVFCVTMSLHGQFSVFCKHHPSSSLQNPRVLSLKRRDKKRTVRFVELNEIQDKSKQKNATSQSRE